jgi:hypothetical protein
MALTTNTQATSSGVVNHSTGVLVNDAGGAVVATLTLGFDPRMIRLMNVTDSISYEWYAGMTNPGATKQLLAGTRSLQTTEGFTVGTQALGTLGVVSIPATIILASKTFVWEALA